MRKSIPFHALPLLALLLLAVFLLTSCSITKTVDWRKLDTPTKRYHFAQLSFEDMQTEFIAMFHRQPEETKAYLRKEVAPVMHKVKLALGAWGEVVMSGVVNVGQESQFTKLFDELILLLKPYLIMEGKK